MYVPKSFLEEDAGKLIAFMRAHSFAILVATVDAEPVAAHIPVVIDAADEQITLRGHIARANPIWKAFDGSEALVIFSGPHAYVSPSSYAKRESVPTWNYIAVHAYGVPHAVHFGDNAKAMHQTLADMIHAYEPEYAAQWDSLPEQFRDGLMQGAVGFELCVTRMEGQYKLSQNRSHADQQNVAARLMRDADPAGLEIAHAMQKDLREP